MNDEKIEITLNPFEEHREFDRNLTDAIHTFEQSERASTESFLDRLVSDVPPPPFGHWRSDRDLQNRIYKLERGEASPYTRMDELDALRREAISRGLPDATEYVFPMERVRRIEEKIEKLAAQLPDQWSATQGMGGDYTGSKYRETSSQVRYLRGLLKYRNNKVR